MGFVIVGFFGLALLAGAAWLIGFVYLHTKDRLRRERERRDADRDQLLQTPGEPLRCVGCGSTFEGPLTELGCANCHTSALVMPERQVAVLGADSGKVRIP